MEFEWKKPVKLDDGIHEGKISKIGYTHKPYEYTEVYISIEKPQLDLRYSCPSILTENSKLGRLLIIFGEKFEENKKVDPEKILVGKEVTFQTITKTSTKTKKQFIEIVEDSIKLK